MGECLHRPKPLVLIEYAQVSISLVSSWGFVLACCVLVVVPPLEYHLILYFMDHRAMINSLPPPMPWCLPYMSSHPPSMVQSSSSPSPTWQTPHTMPTQTHTLQIQPSPRLQFLLPNVNKSFKTLQINSHSPTKPRRSFLNYLNNFVLIIVLAIPSNCTRNFVFYSKEKLRLSARGCEMNRWVLCVQICTVKMVVNNSKVLDRDANV